jgi:hypothetical protein
LVIEHRSSASFVNLTGSGRLSFKTEGADERLDPMPIATCLAAYDRAADDGQAGTATPVPSVAGE